MMTHLIEIDRTNRVKFLVQWNSGGRPSISKALIIHSTWASELVDFQENFVFLSSIVETDWTIGMLYPHVKADRLLMATCPVKEALRHKQFPQFLLFTIVFPPHATCMSFNQPGDQLTGRISSRLKWVVAQFEFRIHCHVPLKLARPRPNPRHSQENLIISRMAKLDSKRRGMGM